MSILYFVQLIRLFFQQYFFCCFWLCHRACGILVPWPGVKPIPPEVDMQSLKPLAHLRSPTTLLIMATLQTAWREVVWICSFPSITALAILSLLSLRVNFRIGRSFAAAHPHGAERGAGCGLPGCWEPAWDLCLRVLPLKISPVCGACRTPTPRQTTAFTCVFQCFPCHPSCGSASWATPEFTPCSAAPMVKMTRSKTFQAYCLLATGPTAAFTAEPTWPITMNLFPSHSKEVKDKHTSLTQ